MKTITFTHRGRLECFPVYLTLDDDSYCECVYPCLNGLMDWLAPKLHEWRSWLAYLVGDYREEIHTHWMFDCVRKLDRPVVRTYR